MTSKAPTVPAGYEADAYIDISGELAEVFYVKGDDMLVYRVSRGEGDNSGDYNTYSNKENRGCERRFGRTAR